MKKLFRLILMSLTGIFALSTLDIEAAKRAREEEDYPSSEEEEYKESELRDDKRALTSFSKQINDVRAEAAARYYAAATPALNDFMGKLYANYHDHLTGNNTLHLLLDSPFHMIILREMIAGERQRVKELARETNIAGITAIEKARSLRFDEEADLLEALQTD